MSRQFVEDLMQIDELEFESDFMRNLVEKGREEGRAEGRAEGWRIAIRAVFAARALGLSADHERQLDACKDLDVLGGWLKRAAVTTAAEDVFRA